MHLKSFTVIKKAIAECCAIAFFITVFLFCTKKIVGHSEVFVPVTEEPFQPKGEKRNRAADGFSPRQSTIKFNLV